MRDPKHINKRSIPLRRRRGGEGSGLPAAFTYSLGLHALAMAAVVLVAELEWSSPVGTTSSPLEVRIASLPSQMTLEEESERELLTELPPVSNLVDLVEELPVFDPAQPMRPTARDPLLEEDPFEALELEAFEGLPEEESVQVEEAKEEPVGEREPLRQLLESPAVIYPESAALRRLEGTVLLSMIVGPDGGVIEVVLVESSGHGSLDRAAIQAARRYRFEPGEGTITVSKPFTFRLS